MGQVRNVLVYRLLCPETIDKIITAILEEKQAIFDAFADKSAVAKESLELDKTTFGELIKAEIDSINAKNGTSTNVYHMKKLPLHSTNDFYFERPL